MKEENFKESLKNIILERSLRFGDFVLSSGKKSNYYIDGKNTTLSPHGLYLVCKIFFSWIKKDFSHVSGIGGPTLGADPIVGGMVSMSYEEKLPLKGFIIRKQPKGHGTNQWIEGIENFSPGEKVILVEDVITTGNTSLMSVEKVNDSGLITAGIFCIVDRMEGAREKFEKMNISFRSIFTISEILNRGM